ncbi:reverse transcriptase domain-containing protein, partial [Tanacetum coccineum]
MDVDPSTQAHMVAFSLVMAASVIPISSDSSEESVELKDRVMARMEERFDQFVDQLSDRIDQLMNKHGNRNVRSTNDEQSENPFGEDDDSSYDEQSGRRPGRNQREDNRRASGSGNVASHFAPSQAKVGGGNTGPVSRASSSSGLKCFNCSEPGHRQSECKKAGKKHLFADPKGDDDAAYEEYKKALV